MILSNVVHMRAVKWFLIYHAIYFLPILICDIITELYGPDDSSFLHLFSSAYVFFSFLYGIFVEPIASGIGMQLIFKVNIISIFILTILKAVISVITITAMSVIKFAFNGYNRYIDGDEWLGNFNFIPYTTLPFLVGILLIYSIQRIIYMFKNRA